MTHDSYTTRWDTIPGGRRSQYFKREALYELVWTAPVSEVAGQLGISDVALAKVCRRTGIPIPYRGYWAKINSGQSVLRTPLSEAPQGLPELLRIRGQKPRAELNSRRNTFAREDQAPCIVL